MKQVYSGKQYRRGWSLADKLSDQSIPEPNSGCWLWTSGSINSSGYPFVGKVAAHRCAWLAFRGPIPPGAHVLHRCDNRLCVNPDHLFLGDNAANVADRVAKGRSADMRGERNSNAKLTPADVLAIHRDMRPHRTVAKTYGITGKTVKSIRTRRLWPEIEREALPLDRFGIVQGEEVNGAKLTPDLVRAIRADPRMQRIIAHDYGITQTLVSQVKLRKIWKHVD
jgi:hypothetical protein